MLVVTTIEGRETQEKVSGLSVDTARLIIDKVKTNGDRCYIYTDDGNTVLAMTDRGLVKVYDERFPFAASETIQGEHVTIVDLTKVEVTCPNCKHSFHLMPELSGNEPSPTAGDTHESSVTPTEDDAPAVL